MKYLNYSFLLLTGLISQLSVAQAPKKDTLKEKVIIEKAYQPVVEDGKKHSFNPSAPIIKPTKQENLNYSVPSQFINSSYALDDIKPLPIDLEQNNELKNYYLKAGYGTMNNPLAQFAISGQKPDNFTAGIIGNFETLKGQEFDDQKMMDAMLQVFGTKQIPNASLNANLHYKHDGDFLYGYDHELLQLEESDIQQAFHQAGVLVGIHSTNNYDFAWNYNADVGIDATTDDLYELSETRANITGNVTKEINDYLEAHVLVDIISRKTKFDYKNNPGKFSNTAFNITPIIQPSIVDNLVLKAGASINYDDKYEFKIFPHLQAEYPIVNERFKLFAGYHGKTENFGLQELKDINSRISPNVRPHNYTKQTITPIGIKGALNSDFSINLYVEHIIEKDKQLFALDPTGFYNYTFILFEEQQLSTTIPQLEVNTQIGEKLDALANLKYNIYDTKTFENAFQLPKFTTDLMLKYQPINKLTIRTDAEILTGVVTYSQKELDAIYNLDLEVEYALTKNFNAFIQGNNLANQKFQKWENYNVVGLNVLGGVILAF